MDLTKADFRPYVDYKVSEVMQLRGKYGFRVTLIYEDLSTRECQHSGYLKKLEAKKARDYVMRPRREFTANSYTTYKNCIEKHINPSIGKLKLQSLNRGHIVKTLNSMMEKYPSMPRVAKSILNTAIEFAVSKNLVTKNPCEEIKLPKGTKKMIITFLWLMKQKLLIWSR